MTTQDRASTSSVAAGPSTAALSAQRRAEANRKPLMTGRQILFMNFGFFGIQYSFGMQQTAINPVFGFLNASPDQLPLAQPGPAR